MKKRKSKRGSYKHLKQKAGGKTSETQGANSETPAQDVQRETGNEYQQVPVTEHHNETMNKNEEVVPFMVPNTEDGEETEQWMRTLWK